MTYARSGYVRTHTTAAARAIDQAGWAVEPEMQGLALQQAGAEICKAITGLHEGLEQVAVAHARLSRFVREGALGDQGPDS